MYYGNIKTCDIANGVGIRVSLFVSGCTNHCKGCFQPETWDFKYGQEYTCETEKFILEALAKSNRAGLTLLGGEPFEPENQRVLIGLVKKVKALYPNKTIWAYTGFIYENLCDPTFSKHCEVTDELLDHVDVLVDGKFEESLRDLSLNFRGSSNQRILDLKQLRLSHQ